MKDDREYEVLRLHRNRVAATSNFEEFKGVQLRLLDWMIENHENKEITREFFERREADIDTKFTG